MHKVLRLSGAIQVGGYIYNTIDLYSQLDYQCGASLTVRARY